MDSFAFLLPKYHLRNSYQYEAQVVRAALAAVQRQSATYICTYQLIALTEARLRHMCTTWLTIKS